MFHLILNKIRIHKRKTPRTFDRGGGNNTSRNAILYYFFAVQWHSYWIIRLSLS